MDANKLAKQFSQEVAANRRYPEPGAIPEYLNRGEVAY